jgi:hypothetical protein
MSTRYIVLRGMVEHALSGVKVDWDFSRRSAEDTCRGEG